MLRVSLRNGDVEVRAVSGGWRSRTGRDDRLTLISPTSAGALARASGSRRGRAMMRPRGVAGAAEIAGRSILHGGNVDRREVAGPQEPNEVDGVAPVQVRLARAKRAHEHRWIRATAGRMRDRNQVLVHVQSDKQRRRGAG